MILINPATEEIITELTADNQQTVNEKYQRLLVGQKIWADTPLENRIRHIERFSALLEEARERLAQTLTKEMGKPIQQSYNEINGARTRIQFFIDHATKWLSEEWIIEKGATREKISYEPLGIIANISAWNYPFLVGVNVFIPALLGGNGVFYKPSEYATLTGIAIQQLLYQAGVPETAFQIAIGNGQVGECLLQLPLNGYYFTGSYHTGKHIAKQVASKMVPCQLELGGKDPLYVMDDVTDIAQVAEAALEGVMYNNGQSCCAVERIYVHEKVYDSFVASIVTLTNQIVVGDPLLATTNLGPLARKEQKDFLNKQINDALSKGAQLASEPKQTASKGYYFSPAILVNVDHSMNIMKEESFGPIVGVQKVASDQEALQLMQDSDYGLTAAIYSSNFERAEALMKSMNTGTVYWNCCDRVSASLPWSGRNHSGMGATLSYQGIRAFVQPKAYHLRP